MGVLFDCLNCTSGCAFLLGCAGSFVLSSYWIWELGGFKLSIYANSPDHYGPGCLLYLSNKENNSEVQLLRYVVFSTRSYAFCVYLQSGYPVHPQNSPYFPFLSFKGHPHCGHIFTFFTSSEGFFISSPSLSKICWFMRQSTSARCAPSEEIP